MIVQGGEAGGHVGEVPTTVLLPQVVDAVDIPVIAAGGFFDGRGLVAALAYGAVGIAMGTRFLLTSDSPVPDAIKRIYLGSRRHRHGRHRRASTASRTACCARPSSSGCCGPARSTQPAARARQRGALPAHVGHAAGAT